MSRSPLTIGQVAALTRLTVRALHHYDAIGLVSPGFRSPAGYRLYTEDDLRRLQQVLLFRELGFGLDQVRDLIDASPERKCEALSAQRIVLLERRKHAEAVLEAVDATLHSLQTDRTQDRIMNTERLFQGYEHFNQGEYTEEAEHRWGQQDAWRTSRERTGRYSKEDWALIEAESEAITLAFRDAMQQALPVDSSEVRALAKRHRAHIDRWFYPCDHAMHASVASIYTADPRFQAHYDRHTEGLADYVEAAIAANARAHDNA
jgi:MerR family transcriptional regulator, thiopeptide resistance regulator